MRTHTNEFKNNIKDFGREIDSQLTYNNTVIDNEDLYNVTPILHTELLKSVMKGLNVETKVNIPIGSEINYQFGVKTRDSNNLFMMNYIQENTNLIKNDELENDFIVKEYWGSMFIPNTYVKKMLKPSTKYTFSFQFKVISRPASLGQYNHNSFFALYKANGSWLGIDSQYKSTGTIGTWYSVTKTITTPSDLTGYNLLAYDYKDTNNDNQGEIEIKEFQIEEGQTASAFALYPYDYVDYGNYIVKENEYNEANENYTLKCYDKMLYSMKEYTTLQSAEFPMTVRDYINALCSDLNLVFANANGTFVNYDKELKTDLYANINYTYRDVLDDLSEATASNICINNNDELEIRYINQTEGKNLFSHSDTFDDPTWGIGGGVDKTTKLDNSYSIKTRNAWAGPYANFKQLYENGKINIGDTVTYSVYFCTNFVPTGNTNFSFTLYRALSSAIFVKTYNYNEIVPNTWYRISKSFVVDDYTIQQTTTRIELNFYDNTDPYYFGDNRQNAVWFARPQIEIGELTDYEPYGDTIDGEYLKDINVNFGEKFGAVNTVVLSRSADSDKIARSIPSDLADEDKIAITIRDNQIMNGDDRGDYLENILNKLNGLEFYLNDYTSTGITYYEACDRYNVLVNGTYYPCIMFNDEVNITQGLVEQIDTPMPETSETEYKYVTPTDKLERTTSLIVDKVNSRITAQAETIEIIATNIDKTNGDIKSVTPANDQDKYFTFNSDGLTIASGNNGFRSLSNEQGTYYYDGEYDPNYPERNKIGEYTKDGSKQKDLSLFGAYKYGMDEITDTPLFVAQLYTIDDEQGIGHFWNGSDI